MNILALFLAQYVGQNHAALTMPRIIFWLLLILWAIGSFSASENPYVVRGTSLVLIILFAVLGYYVFGF